MTAPKPPTSGASRTANTPSGTSRRFSRRRFAGLAAAASAAGLSGAAALLSPSNARLLQPGDATPPATPEATPSAIQSNVVGELPTSGAMRPGPVGQQPQGPRAINATAPLSIQVPAAEVDAEVEVQDIVDGVMLDPTGPWIVAWYQQTSQLGEAGNVVLSGHIDYWDVGPAVFYTVGDLVEDDEILLIGENEMTSTYLVEWVQTYFLDELTSGGIQEIVGPTDYQATTLITCGGEFDYETGEYLSRVVVRGRLAPEEEGTPEATPPN